MGDVVANNLGLEGARASFNLELELDPVLSGPLVACDEVARCDVVAAEVSDALVLAKVKHSALEDRVSEHILPAGVLEVGDAAHDGGGDADHGVGEEFVRGHFN